MPHAVDSSSEAHPIPTATTPAQTRRLFRAALVAGAVAWLAIVVAVARQWLILGSIASGWWYHYLQPFSLHALVVGTLAGVAAASLARLPPLRTGWSEWRLVLCWVLVAFGLQAFVRSLTPVSVQNIFVSDSANSFYSVTQRHDPATILAGFNRVRRESALHAQSNMPGKVLLIHALQSVSPRTDVLPWLLVLLSNLGGVLMYLFVRLLFDDRTVALYAMVLYLFVPAKLVFFPLMNTVTPVVLLCSLSILTVWLRTSRTVWPALLGVLLYVLVFFEPLPLVGGLLFAALSVRAIILGALSWQRFALQAALMVLVFITTAELMRLAFGFDLVAAFRSIGAHAVHFNETEGRRYAVWVWLNVWEFAFGTGIVQTALFVAAVIVAPRAVVGRRLLEDPLPVLTLSLAAILIASDLFGINRGEVVRLWIFLACLFQIPAACICARLQHDAAIGVVLATSVIQAALATHMIGFLIP